MDGAQCDVNVNLNLPLIQDQNHEITQNSGTASFLNTCFNGLNALSEHDKYATRPIFMLEV
ncbi:hypothetical protein CR513_47245, partial [Mucuna pruriens]